MSLKDESLSNPLLIWRAISAVACTIIVCTCFGIWIPSSGGRVLLYYTNLSFLLLTIYFCLAFFISARAYYKSRKSSLSLSDGFEEDHILEDVTFPPTTREDNLDGPLVSTPPHSEPSSVPGSPSPQVAWHGRLMWVLFELCFTNALFLDIVFWGLLFPLDPYWQDPTTYLVHLSNLIFISVELMLNSLCFVYPHFVFQILYLICYGIIALSWHAASGLWTYPFLDYHSILALVYYPAMVVGSLICFTAGFGLTKIRDRSAGVVRSRYTHVES